MHNSNVIKTVYAEDDCIWCGTVLGEVYRFDLATRRFSLFYKYPIELAIYGIVRDADGNLWVGTSKGGYALTCFTPAGERKTEFTGPKGEKIAFFLRSLHGGRESRCATDRYAFCRTVPF